jgi:glycosyltransferase involved in cell wall biosynthesis
VNVLQVFKDVYPPTVGGIEFHVHDVIRSLPDVTSTVLTSSRSWQRHEDVDGPVRTIRAPEYLRLFSTPFTPSWFRDLRQLPADVVHLHMPNPIAEVALVAPAAALDAPIVATFHADVTGASPASALYGRLQRRALRRASTVVVSSPPMARSPVLSERRPQLEVIPYGTDAGDWPVGDDEIENVRRRYPGPLLLFLGRLVHYKGVDVLSEAMRALDATLLVAGDGPRRSSLEAHAARAGVGERVVFLGQVANQDRAAYYRAADLFVLPSVTQAEAFGIAMLEAMACGTPAICTEVGTGTSWVNRHGETGLVVPPKDPAALVEAIRTVLTDAALRHDLGAAAAHRARHDFSKPAMLRALADLYGSTASSVPPRTVPLPRS